MTDQIKTTVELLVCVALCFLPGIVGSRSAPGAWYASLTKPALTPPGWAFPVVWTALYLLMGVALFLAWRAGSGPGLRLALTVFAVQLVLNGLWSWLFFGLKRPDLALADILLLWLAIGASIVLFWRLRPLAGALLVPYLLWVSLATWLNFGLWRLNR
jgi:tryptophan-rich sensory protein